MASPLESAITLEDVFAMVVGKRVPLAPELAGYLSLEVAEKADAAGWAGDVDPRSVYIADEGTVVLVRPRGEPAPGDAEQSIRGMLAHLLEASGSSTPALTAVSRRARAGSLRTLMEDIEAALIPVNRAAGRRALARLAREVKRITQGVGRNAPASRSSGDWTGRQSRPEDPPPPKREAPEPRAPSRLPKVTPPPVPPNRAGSSSPPAAGSRGEDPARVPESVPANATGARPLRPAAPPPAVAASVDHPSALFDNPSDVDSLLEQFSRSTTQTDEALSRDLKDLVDVGKTASPPEVRPGNLPARRFAPPTPDPAAPPERRFAPPTPDPAGPPRRFAPPTPDPSAPARPTSGAPAFPPPAHAPPSVPPPSPDVDDLLALTDDVAPAAAPPAAAPPSVRPAASMRAPAPPTNDAPPSSRATRPAAAPAAVNPRDLPTHLSLPVANEWHKPKKKRTDYWIIIALLAVLALASGTVWFFKPGFLSGRTAERVAQEKAANDVARQKALAAQQALSCHAAIDVTDIPTGAEVLLRVGQAPVDVPHLPVGARLEFVATAEGYSPKRVVVPAAASWDNGPDGKPRFEVAVQLDKSNPKAKLGDAWPPGEAGSEVGGKGPPGTVHLVSTPRAAEIWMLAGLGPEALVEQLPCDQSVDVLVAGPTTFRKRLHATAADFVARPGEASSRILKLSAK